MRWLVGNWQLKLISILLTLALLAAIAFTQNPPTTATVSLHIAYPTPPSQLVLVNPPTTIQVHVVGLANSVRDFKQTFASSPGARVDLSSLTQGSGQSVSAQVTASAGGVSVSPGSVPVRVDLETMQTVRLPIQVRVSNVNSSAGLSVVKDGTYATCGSDTVKCQVTVRAPSSVVSGLVAYLSYVNPQPNQAGLERVPGLPIRFERNGKSIDLTGTTNLQVYPNRISVQPDEATARVETQGGTLTTTAPVFIKTTGTLACGYQVQSLAYSPSTITVSGPTQTVAKLTSVELSSVDVSDLAASETVTRTLSLPSGVQAAAGTPTSIMVTVTLSQAYSCVPSSGSGGGGGTSTPQATATPAATPVPTTSPHG